MKQLYLTLIFGLFIFNCFGQTQVCENFSGRHDLPSDWYVGGGAQIVDYDNPSSNVCTPDIGLQTPGIGGANPSRIIQSTQTFSTAAPIIKTSFDLFVFDANTKCLSAKAFPCTTWVKIYVVDASFTNRNSTPEGTEIFYESEYRIAYANGSNTAVLAPSIPNGTSYRIMYDFKVSGAECVQGNTKYVIDNICTTTEAQCPGYCIPLANDDYFAQGGPGGFSGNTFSANVYGGFLPWASVVPTGFEMRSLNASPAENAGLDSDDDNPPLSSMTFTKLSGPAVAGSIGCAGVPSAGTLTFNSNGTFTYTRTDNCVSLVTFTYNITDGTGLTSNTATVFIEFPANIPTPVQWKTFKAVRANNWVYLNWATASEVNNKGFNIQRNARGIWETIGFVPSAADGGNSAAELSYSYVDENAATGVAQYRIQQLDIDGKSKYSEIRSVRGQEMSSRLLVYPNPSTTGTIFLVFADQTVKDVQILDMAGRIIRQLKTVSSGAAIHGLENGLYTVRISAIGAATITTNVMVRKQ